METPDEIRSRLEALHYGEGTGVEVAICEIKIEQAVQLALIHQELVTIRKEGLYTYPQVGDVPPDDQ